MQVRRRKRVINRRILATAVFQYDYCKTRLQALRHFFTLRITARGLRRVRAAKTTFVTTFHNS